jgi:hypothetical protein
MLTARTRKQEQVENARPSPRQRYWVKANGTREEFERDKATCFRVALLADLSLQRTLQTSDLCLRSRGWELQ